MKDQDHLKIAVAAGEFHKAIKKQKIQQVEPHNMKPKIKNLSPSVTSAIIMAAVIIIAAFLYAFAHRYSINGSYLEDKWTGTYQKMEEKK
jgi:hypothetical protein